ncbi:serine/threonine-protein kinase [Streptomyces sp. NPDC047000]|uniref:serine/threonine-protein kinase n=1 Tax=Streptomyces sp. NPDC047000 TaxID=3155474 RepID=UPI0033E31B94
MSEVGELEPDPDGRLIDGRYALLERVGAGGSGTVWRAHDQARDREVAVKQPRLVTGSPRSGERDGESDGEERMRAVNRLCHEARVAARLDHPSAVVIHDVVVEDGLPWIVMEYVRGESLGTRLRRGTVPHDEAARIGLAVLGALRAAHAAGMVHRDLKPANVLLGEDGRVLLTDFGIAHGSGDDAASGDGEFVAPEQLSGPGAGPASDLWALGALLHVAVGGSAPERGAAGAGDPPVDEQAGPLGALLVRMLAREPGERPGAAEVAAVLEAVAHGRETPEVPVTAPAKATAPEPVAVALAAEVPGAETPDGEGPDGGEKHADPSAGDPAGSDAGLRNGPLRRLLTGLGLTLPPVTDRVQDPDHRPSARAIR